MAEVTSIDDEMTLDNILGNSRLHQELTQFVEKKGGIEYLLLYENIKLFEEVNDKSYRDFVGRKLVVLFIKPHSQYNTLIPEKTRQTLVDMEEKNVTFDVDSFLECKTWLRRYIETEILQPFRELKETEQPQPQPQPLQLPLQQPQPSSQPRQKRRNTLKRIKTMYGRILKGKHERS